MHSLLASLLLFALPFWGLNLKFRNSPWAKASGLTGVGKAHAGSRRGKTPKTEGKSDTLAEEYRAWAAENQVVLAATSWYRLRFLIVVSRSGWRRIGVRAVIRGLATALRVAGRR